MPAAAGTADPLGPHIIEAGTSHINCVRFSSDGTILWSGGMDARLRLWNVGDWSDAGEWRGHEKSVNTLALSAGGTRLVTGSTDRTVRVWDVKTGQQLKVVNGWQNGSPDSELTRIGLAKDSHMMGIWDVEAESMVRKWPTQAKRGGWIRWSPDGSQVLCGGMTDEIAIHDATTGEVVTRLTGHSTAVAPPLWSPDRTRMLTSGHDGTCRLWDPSDWSHLATWDTHQAGLWGRAWHPSEDVVVLTRDHTVTFWDPATGSQFGEITLKPKGIYQADISPDAEWLAVSSADKRVRIWNLPTVLDTLRQ